MTEVQSKAIVDMRLGQLTGLERDKIETEFAELQVKIKYYKEILASEEMVYDIVKEELIQIRDKFGDDRRTKLQPSANDIFFLNYFFNCCFRQNNFNLNFHFFKLVLCA